MPITRTAMIDDDGSGTTGTIFNNAWKQELYNQIDALGAGLPIVTGPWTPNDASTAGLVFTVNAANSQYWKMGKLVILIGHVVYPATANGLGARIGGLPFVNGPGVGAISATWLQAHMPWLAASSNFIGLYNPTTGAARTNAELTGATFAFGGHYFTA